MVFPAPTRTVLRRLTPSLRRTYLRTSHSTRTASHIRTPLLLFTLPAPRTFHSTPSTAGIMPDTSTPAPREAEAEETASQRTEISMDEYNALADGFLEELQARLEQRQEAKGDLVDVEYSVSLTPSLSLSLYLAWDKSTAADW